MRARRNLFLLDLYTICTSLNFTIPILLLYYRDKIGLDFQDLLITQAVYAAAIVLFEIPTGWLSDIWQRKQTLALGATLKIVAFIILFSAHNLYMVMAYEILRAGAISLISGTNSALLYESLQVDKKRKVYLKAIGKLNAFTSYGLATSAIVGGFLYVIHTELPLIFTVFSLTTAILFTCVLDEPKRRKQEPQKNPIKDMLVTVRYALRGHVEIAFIILFSAALLSGTRIIIWAQQPYYIDLGIPEALFGVLLAAGSMVGGFSSQLSHLVTEKITVTQSLFFAWVFSLLTCIVAGADMGYVGVCILIFGGVGILNPVKSRVHDAINNKVGSSRRATILSTQSLMVSLLFIPLSLTLGWVHDTWGIQGVFTGMVGWLLLCGVCLLCLSISNKKKMN